MTRRAARGRARVLPLPWRHTAAVCIGAVLCAAATYLAAVHWVIVPACRADARLHGMTFDRFDFSDHRHGSEIVCVSHHADGTEHRVSLQTLAPFLTDFAASLATDIEITVPAFAVAGALLWGLLIGRPLRRRRGAWRRVGGGHGDGSAY